MPGLSTRDVTALNAAAMELYATQTVEEFSMHIRLAMHAMFGSVFSVTDWVDPRTSLSLACQYYPDHVISEELNALGHTLLPHSPIWLKCAEQPLSLSDLVSRTKWERMDLHWAVSQIGVKDYTTFDVSLTPSLTLMIGALRERYGSQAPHERLMLQLFGAHVRQAYRRLAAQGQGLPCGEIQRRHVVLPLGRDGRNCQWSREIRGLLAQYGFHIARDELPGTIKDWFLEQRRTLEQSLEVSSGPLPLRLDRGWRVLSIYLMRGREPRSYQLVLQEKDAPFDAVNPLASLRVTPREAEVLQWLAQGKTNPEIAGILGLSQGTVRRHLENIYPKLGVENRGSAALIVLQAQRLQNQPT